MARPVSAECAPVTRVPLGNFTDTGPRDIDPPHFKKGCLPHHPLHSGAKCSPCATWLTLAPSQSQEPAKQWLCQPDGGRWTDRLELQPYFCSDSLPRVRPSSLIGASCLWSAGQEDGAQERVSHLGFAGLCDNLQQRAMSRRCLPLQQPLRRVSEDPPHTPFICEGRARTPGKAHGTSFFCREPHAKDGLYLAQRGSLCSPPSLFGVVFTFKT